MYFFGLEADVDYHVFNGRLIQLFGVDEETLQMGRIADLVRSVANTGMGNTVKMDMEYDILYTFY
ncbi:hypothetical protein ID866_12922 [Astraeus odoratus]|nr:hypothetical protein ID866_12922 [Astraeus odoratus]